MPRVRSLTATGDMQFGRGSANFLVNSPGMVAQNIRTRLLLYLGEWFVNTADGTPWFQRVIGKQPAVNYDAAIRDRVQSTAGVISVGLYSSALDPIARTLTVQMQNIQTIYGSIQGLDFAFPMTGGA